MGAPDRAVLVARKAFVGQMPKETLSILKGINLGIDAITEMDYLANARGMSPRQAARTWMEGHTGKVAEWFSQ